MTDWCSHWLIYPAWQGVVVIALFYGFFSGTFVSLPPTCFVWLSPDRSLIGTRMGMGYAVMAVENLIETPSAGAILQNKGFNTMWIFSAVISVVGGLTMIFSRNIQDQWKPLARLWRFKGYMLGDYLQWAFSRVVCFECKGSCKMFLVLWSLLADLDLLDYLQRYMNRMPTI